MLRATGPARRASGLLVPLFSIPSSESWGIGEALDLPILARWLRRAGMSFVQILPINEMAVWACSPYSALSAMAIDPVYIRVPEVDDFVALGGESAMGADWQARLAAVRATTAIDYQLVRAVKREALVRSFDRFRREEWERGTVRDEAFREWMRSERWWLEEYALYRALHAAHGDRAWARWPARLRDRHPAALDAARTAHAEGVLFRSYLQWVAAGQWQEARRRAGEVAVFGDLPFMVDGDSADVWSRQREFRLDASVGAPPDAFSADGQDWGLPACQWEAMEQGGFEWIRARARRSAELFDGYRVDHLVGFFRTYMIPKDGSTRFFSPGAEADQVRLGETIVGIFAAASARVVAEDLGTVPAFVRDSLASLGVPGFKVLRWEREWEEEERPFRDPASYPAVSVATTGTHDTETLAAWWDGLDADERRKVGAIESLRARIDPEIDVGEMPFTLALRDAMLETMIASGSDLLVLPVQDVFGWRDRINVPASVGATNWTWRLPWPCERLLVEPNALERADFLRQTNALAGRVC